jgi:hypothetical protein
MDSDRQKTTISQGSRERTLTAPIGDLEAIQRAQGAPAFENTTTAGVSTG